MRRLAQLLREVAGPWIPGHVPADEEGVLRDASFPVETVMPHVVFLPGVPHQHHMEVRRRVHMAVREVGLKPEKLHKRAFGRVRFSESGAPEQFARGEQPVVLRTDLRSGIGPVAVQTVLNPLHIVEDADADRTLTPPRGETGGRLRRCGREKDTVAVAHHILRPIHGFHRDTRPDEFHARCGEAAPGPRS